MSTDFITFKQVEQWFEDLDQALKDSIMNSATSEDRDKDYHLYQASQLLRARMLGDFSKTVEFINPQYDD